MTGAASPVTLREQVRRERTALLESTPPERYGGALSRALTELTDHVVLQVLAAASGADLRSAPRRLTTGEPSLPPYLPPRLSALALGGYGRGELSPGSDVDLLLLHDGELDDSLRAVVERAVQGLWDAGFELGHSIHSLDSLRRALEEDGDLATAVLESRLLAGDPALETALRERTLGPWLAERGPAFRAMKVRERHHRREKAGSSVFVMEPDVKEGKGGLRDLHLLRWLAASQGEPLEAWLAREAAARPEEVQALHTAYDRVLAVRNCMHRLEGRHVDRLDMGLQPRVAEALGYKDEAPRLAVEALMQDHYFAARELHRMLGRAVGWSEDGAPSLRRGPRALRGRRTPVGEHYTAVDGEIYLAERDPFAGGQAAACAKVLPLFLEAQRRRLDLGEETYRLLRAHVHLIDDAFRGDPGNAAVFMEILSGAHGVGRVLTAMHRADVLGEYIPEFGELTCLVQYDPYHAYTVDEHTLLAVERLEELGRSRGREREDRVRRDLYASLRRPDLLRLALLLHDCGKAVGPDHAQVGADMVVQAARRLGLSDAETELVRFLVQEHLSLNNTAERRDPTAPETIAGFAAGVGDLERLRMLYLLTCADVAAVGPHAWTGWKDVLMTELYLRTADRLAGVDRPVQDPLERLLSAQPERLRERAAAHLRGVPRRYLLEVQAEEVPLHLDLLDRVGRGEDPAVHVTPRRGFAEVWVGSRDRPALFATMAGAFSACGINILSAHAYTLPGGLVLDRFRITGEAGDAPGDPSELARVVDTLSRALHGQLDLQAMLDRRSRRVNPDRPFRPGRKRRIRAYNKVLPGMTLLEVIMEDRPGLLYSITRALSDQGLDLHFARITTKADKAVDAFYLTTAGRKLTDEEIRGVVAALEQV